MTTYATIDAYIATFPEERQAILQKVRNALQRALPGATEAISYDIPTFKVDGKYVVYFAGWKEHLSLYPIPAGNEAFQKEIAPFKTGRGTLRFPLDKPLPLELMAKVAALLLAERRDRT